MEKCKDCNGKGLLADLPKIVCLVCNGTGEVEEDKTVYTA